MQEQQQKTTCNKKSKFLLQEFKKKKPQIKHLLKLGFFPILNPFHTEPRNGFVLF